MEVLELGLVEMRLSRDVLVPCEEDIRSLIRQHSVLRSELEAYDVVRCLSFVSEESTRSEEEDAEAGWVEWAVVGEDHALLQHGTHDRLDVEVEVGVPGL